ncbi:hypothetical protein LCGC14_0364130 [marine sediment metagenome]|uniref:Uncharacterized protein n=1 Tax=marine sediment metagenome TaxID=412755 RepID=A0A0F9TCX0_9ZZZZ
MQHVKNRLVAMKQKREAGLHSKQTQCEEETSAEIDTLLSYVQQKLKEA